MLLLKLKPLDFVEPLEPIVDFEPQDVGFWDLASLVYAELHE